MSEQYVIDTKDSAIDFIEYVKSLPSVVPKVNGSVVEFNGDTFEILDKYRYVLDKLQDEPEEQPEIVETEDELERLIFGKDTTKEIVSVEVRDDIVYLFKNDGSIEERDAEYWITSSRALGKGTQILDGDLHYKYKKTFTQEGNYKEAKSILYKKNADFYTVSNQAEAYMIKNGVTMFKGLQVSDVSVLSFDIESTGVAHDENSKVLLISNTFRDRNGKVTRKLFALDDYDGHDSLMIEKWTDWVREVDPTVVIGHNIFTFDLPYLSYCYRKRNPHHNDDMYLGRDGSEIQYANRPKKIRKDGSQSYDVFEANIFGRQIIDTWILSIKYDVGRNYTNYKLKSIIAEEGLEKKDRTKFNFEEILPKDIWKRYLAGDTEMWEAFKKYCIEDSDDSLKLYDLMIPQYFYYTQSLPMTFQTMCMTATGRQINAFLCRSYLQEGHSIPKKSEKVHYEGGISFGNPGVYSHVYKLDVASLYPSIMITENIYDEQKDPKANFLTMVKYFTKERLENKKRANETGDRYYRDMEQAQKIVINSAYGLLGADGINFNSMQNADKVTAKGREILRTGIKWAEDKGYQIVNVDTDSFSYTSGKKLALITQAQAEKKGVEPRDEFEEHIEELNGLFKDGILWEDDGYFKKFIVVAAKNYILDDGKKIKIKGQSLKGTGKEPALVDFMNTIIALLLKNKKDHIFHEYLKVANRIKNNWDVNEWCMKKTVTKSVLNPERTQEQKVLDAIQDIHYQEGDKVYLYVKDKDTLRLKQDFDGEYLAETYYNKLYNTLCIFKNLLDPSVFPNFKLSRNKDLL